MKYLKKFNESNTLDVEDVKSFCNQYLAYLLDDKSFNLDIYDNTIFDDGDDGGNEIEIVLYCPSNHDPYFTELSRYWRDIKDDFIPFLNVLNDRYPGLNKKIGISSKNDGPGHDFNLINLDDLLNDNYSNDRQLYYIAIEIDRDSKIND